MTAYVKIGGVYRSVAEANAFLKLGNSYTNGTLVGGYVKVNNEYKKFYTGTDKKTFTLYPNPFASYPTRFARGTTWGNSGNAPWNGDGATTLAIGRYVSASYSLPRYYGILDFVFTNENSSYLATELAERPYVHSASLRLTRHAQTGQSPKHGASTTSGTVYVGEYSGNTTTTYPACSGITFTDSASSSLDLGYGDTVNINLNSAGHMQDLIAHVAGGGDLAITNENSGICNNGNSFDQDYCWFYGGPGNATSIKPMLTVELDYIPPE